MKMQYRKASDCERRGYLCAAPNITSKHIQSTPSYDPPFSPLCPTVTFSTSLLLLLVQYPLVCTLIHLIPQPQSHHLPLSPPPAPRPLLTIPSPFPSPHTISSPHAHDPRCSSANVASIPSPKPAHRLIRGP